MFSGIPLELQEQIQTFLNIRELLMLSLTSKENKAWGFDNDRMWRFHISQECGDPEEIMEKTNAFLLSKNKNNLENFKELYKALSCFRRTHRDKNFNAVSLKYGQSNLKVAKNYLSCIVRLGCSKLVSEYLFQAEIRKDEVTEIIKVATDSLDKSMLDIFNSQEVRNLQEVKCDASKIMAEQMFRSINMLSNKETHYEKELLKFDFLVRNSNFTFMLDNVPIVKQAIEEVDKNKRSVLTAAISEGFHNSELQDNLIRILLDNGANTDVTHQGLTPLLLAVDSPNLNLVPILFQYGAKVINQEVDLNKVRTFIAKVEKRLEFIVSNTMDDEPTKKYLETLRQDLNSILDRVKEQIPQLYPKRASNTDEQDIKDEHESKRRRLS